MELEMKELFEEIEEQSKTLYPKSLTAKQLEIFIRENRGLSPSEVKTNWEKRKLAQIRTWRGRYGMDDFYPFGAKETKKIFSVRWAIDLYGNYQCDFDFAYEPPMELKGVCDSAGSALLRVEKLIKAQYDRFNGKIELNNLRLRGELSLYTTFEPEHDWRIWRNRILETYSIPSGKLSKLIQNYRKGKIEGCDSLDKLERKILEEAKGG